jgi:enoyl-CoA hydratase/carnithine racemase
MADLVLVEEPAPHIRVLSMNRPEQLNAMTAELCQALHDELRAAAEARRAAPDRARRSSR